MVHHGVMRGGGAKLCMAYFVDIFTQKKLVCFSETMQRYFVKWNITPNAYF
jgi:hypothetical protein